MLKSNTNFIDLGKIRYGVPYTFIYHLTNEGNEVITIDKFSPGCSSCTTVSIGKTILNPSDSTVLTVTYTPGAIGLRMKFVNIFYNSTEVLKVEFSGNAE